MHNWYWHLSAFQRPVVYRYVMYRVGLQAGILYQQGTTIYWAQHDISACMHQRMESYYIYCYYMGLHDQRYCWPDVQNNFISQTEWPMKHWIIARLAIIQCFMGHSVCDMKYSFKKPTLSLTLASIVVPFIKFVDKFVTSLIACRPTSPRRLAYFTRIYLDSSAL